MINQKEIGSISLSTLHHDSGRETLAISNTNSAATVWHGWHLALWAAQIFLATFFALYGWMHVNMNLILLIANGETWAGATPLVLVRLIGGLELAGVLGIVLPAFTRVQPGLTPLTALGFLGIQALAMPVNIYCGNFGVLPINGAIAALSFFVFWGRTRRAFISPR